MLQLAFLVAAQGVFSPGPLSSVHKQIDGLTQCTKCHEGEGGKHSNPNCLACHAEIDRSKFHANYKAQFCAECHKEHKGGDGPSLIDWVGGKRGFNHERAQWPLVGAHKKVDCAKCHEGKRIVDDSIKKLVAEKKRADTMMGLSTSCAKCHFDEHRGQEGSSCDRCHTSQTSFKDASLFRHSRPFTEFALKGQHKNVECKKCHDDTTDETTPADAFPAPRARTYMQMQLKGIGENSCIACHEDVHHGEFGKNCAKCHVEDGWKIIKQTAQDTGFHDKTDFPLRGEHTSVACKSCHGPFPGVAAKFKGLKHKQCADCHADGHEGQIPLEDGVVKCERCHSVNGFVPSTFDAKLHDATRFPLEGSHKAVACNLCHKQDKALSKKVPSAIRASMASRGRPVLASTMQLAFATFSGRCEACHQDTHGGQFDAKNVDEKMHTRSAEKTKDEGCIACHNSKSWSDMTSFVHDDTAFPLTGKHRDVQCGACHFVPPDAKGRMREVVAYRGLEVQCASCHADEHVGQLAKTSETGSVTACETCHATKAWKPATFDHDKQSTFPLVGKHKEAKCVDCHQLVDTGTKKTAKYKPLPPETACAGCHEDEHKGAFDSFIPVSTMPKAEERCAACHTPKGWSPAKLAHDKTSFPLKGKHNGVSCDDCHGGDTTRPIPTSCAGCHQDPHGLEFGLQCKSCHSEEGFAAPAFAVDAHRKTNFPLTGRHAALPCEECHIEKREMTFTRAALTCDVCHAKDALRASAETVSHKRAPFTGDCRLCHQPVAFTPASYADHERCFPIARGVHAPVSCAECHGNLTGVQPNNTCANVAVKCAECHTHSAAVEAKHHKGVAGYEHTSAKCAACHRAAG